MMDLIENVSVLANRISKKNVQINRVLKERDKLLRRITAAERRIVYLESQMSGALPGVLGQWKMTVYLLWKNF